MYMQAIQRFLRKTLKEFHGFLPPIERLLSLVKVLFSWRNGPLPEQGVAQEGWDRQQLSPPVPDLGEGLCDPTWRPSPLHWLAYSRERDECPLFLLSLLQLLGCRLGHAAWERELGCNLMVTSQLHPAGLASLPTTYPSPAQKHPCAR